MYPQFLSYIYIDNKLNQVNMGKHVNHQDVQDRIISKIKTNKPTVLAERDPGSLSIEEQEILVKEKMLARAAAKPAPKIIPIRFSGRRP